MSEQGNPLNATEGFEWSSLVKGSNFDSPTQAWDASGMFGSAANVIYDGIKGDWGAVAADTAGLGLDLLGFAMDPLGSILSSVIGWLIEHIGFLKEPLDLLAGDPDAVTAMATTWKNIAKRLHETSQKYSETLGTLEGTHGAAIDGYRKAVQNFSQVVSGGGAHADSAAQAMTVAASAVGVVRGIIRDLIANFAADAIIKFAAASALAPVTFGASEAAFIADTVAEGAVLAGKNAKKVSKLVKQLEKVADDAKHSRNMIKGTTRNLDQSVNKFNSNAVKHAQESLNMAKKAQAGKLGADDLEKLKELGKRGDDLKAAKSAKDGPADQLGQTWRDNAQDRYGSTNPRAEALEGHVETQGGFPKAPKIVANSIVQGFSDQVHREQDGQVKQDDKDKEWREYWEAERKAAENPPVQGPRREWRLKGNL
ncbi:hypothetical protein Lesp02_50200 [Lentzea sp. NBRC 105346]|uniref:hypothetical protein n=1 Tax=Lentzea sp. NBRC 105346 TaxID=3032205 RepID=UPI0024A49DEF|nr:hypothetical protein [Lentzea sp. NBRC 105346]GLZ32832.1 hypothetical protein Lesp02_50200 [Lentzea sp. NBRC 105346]